MLLYSIGLVINSHTYRSPTLIAGDQTVKEFRKYLPPPNSDPKVIGEARANTQKGSRELLEVIYHAH